MEEYHASSTVPNNRLICPSDETFCKIYHEAIDDLLNILNPQNVKAFNRYCNLLQDFSNSYCEFNEDSYQRDIGTVNLLKDSLFYRIAYAYRNGIVLSSATAFHFKNTIDKQPWILDRLLKKGSIRICCLGCGPSSDIVGVVALLESLCQNANLSLDIRVTLVDVDDSWKCTSLAILRCLQSFRKATCKIDFIHADLSTYPVDGLVRAIQESDIVSAVKFCSEFVMGHRSFLRTLQNITKFMKPGSLLFFLDRHQDRVIKNCGAMGDEVAALRLVYEEACDLHALDESVIISNYHKYSNFFGSNVCNTYLKIFARAWTKCSDDRNVRELSPEKRFSYKSEKYDAFEFFMAEAFDKWECHFTNHMIRDGWSQSGVENYAKEQKEMRRDLLAQLQEHAERVESSRSSLIQAAQCGFVEFSAWQNYANVKRDMANIKRLIYCENTINLRGSLKSAYVQLGS